MPEMGRIGRIQDFKSLAFVGFSRVFLSGWSSLSSNPFKQIQRRFAVRNSFALLPVLRTRELPDTLLAVSNYEIREKTF